MRRLSQSKSRYPLWAVAAAVLSVALAGDARAWTEAEVETVQVRIAVDESAEARVHLDLRLHVRGGWLENLEVAGLDEGYALEEGVTFRSDAGETFQPRVTEREDGRLQFSFARRNAPRRGEYIIGFSYLADLSNSARPEEDRTRYEWTLPGWRTGLDGVLIEIHGPGLHFADSEDALTTISKERAEAEGETVLRWHRAHLPRTLPWTVGFTLGSAPPPPHVQATSPDGSAESLESSSHGSASGLPSLALLWLSILSALSLLVFDARAKRHGTKSRPLLPIPRGARLLALGALGAASVLISRGLCADLGVAGLAAAILLGFERTPATIQTPRLGSWRALPAGEAMRVLHRPWDALFDGGRPTGLVFLALTATLVSIVEPLEAVHLALLAPWLTGTGAQLPSSPANKRWLLARFATQLRTRLAPTFALGLAVHEDAHGNAQDVRLRIVTVDRAPGLVRLDVAVGERVGPGGVHRHVCVLIVTREGTAAHTIAVTRFGNQAGHRTPGGRVVWTATVSDIEELAAAFGEKKRKSRQQPARRKLSSAEVNRATC